MAYGGVACCCLFGTCVGRVLLLFRWGVGVGVRVGFGRDWFSFFFDFWSFVGFVLVLACLV